jgi:hypothetical protein
LGGPKCTCLHLDLLKVNSQSFDHCIKVVYDLPDVVQNVAKLFADDTKLNTVVNNTNDEMKLQGDIDRLMQWSKDWLLTFNKSKCKHVHFYSRCGRTILL